MLSQEYSINVDCNDDKRRMFLKDFDYLKFIRTIRTMYKITKSDWSKYKIFYTDYIGTFHITNKDEFQNALVTNCTESCLNIRLYYERDITDLLTSYEFYLSICSLLTLLLISFVEKFINPGVCEWIFRGVFLVALLIPMFLFYWTVLGKLIFNWKNKEYQILAIIQFTQGKLHETDYEKIKTILNGSICT